MRAQSVQAGPAATKVVAFASSAGGVRALGIVLTALPADLPAAMVAVQHLDPKHNSLLPEILSRSCSIEVRRANDGDVLREGVVYVAPPDRHLLVNPDATLSLTHTELVNFVRPSADLLFDSVAASFRTRAIAVVLSGTGRDGSLGVRAIKQTGGIVVVEDEDTSEFPGMPHAAREMGADYVVPLENVAPLLIALIRGEGL
ncbi:MAG TPA: chemotaxis protein CheB [Candidatus Dormibacteraeota bacterium]|nr:chemotaxis protein CheB [Candidatus Dormibacteraeota bacterium]